MSKRKHPKQSHEIDLSKPVGLLSFDSKCFGKFMDFKNAICKTCPVGALCLISFNKRVRKGEAKLDKKHGPFADTIDFDRVYKAQVEEMENRKQGLGKILDYIQAESRCKDRKTVEYWYQNNFKHNYKNPLKIAQ